MSNWEKLPCGCKMGTVIVDGIGHFMFEPCSIDCKWYAYVIKTAEELDKPTTTIEI